MVLKVEVVESPQGAVISEASKTISEQGGSFGRGENNSWVLDDPERFLSSRHCEFSYEAGQYYLTDLSTNGTFMNGSPEPLGRGSKVQLQNGDKIELGEYKFAVQLDSASSDFVGDSGLDPFSSPASPFDSAPLPLDTGSDPLAFGNSFGTNEGGVPNDLGAIETDPLAALDKVAADPFSAASTPFEPGLSLNPDAPAESFPYGQNTFSDNADPMAGSFELPAAAGSVIPEDWEDDLGMASPPTAAPIQLEAEPPRPQPPQPKPAARPRPAAARAARRDISQPNHVVRKTPKTKPVPPQAAPKPAAKKASQAVALERHTGKTLLDAMGLDAQSLSAKEQVEMAGIIGELMPVVVEGMMRVLRSRASIKNEFRMNVTTIQPIENNPLKFSADAHEALENMFIRKSKAYKGPVESFSEGFNAIAEHQVAIIAGIRAAFSKMIEHFDPGALEGQFDKQNKGVVIPGMQKARYWASYTDYYQSFIDNMEQSFQNLFGDEFVRAYEDQLFQLMSARNNEDK